MVKKQIVANRGAKKRDTAYIGSVEDYVGFRGYSSSNGESLEEKVEPETEREIENQGIWSLRGGSVGTST